MLRFVHMSVEWTAGEIFTLLLCGAIVTEFFLIPPGILRLITLILQIRIFMHMVT